MARSLDSAAYDLATSGNYDSTQDIEFALVQEYGIKEVTKYFNSTSTKKLLYRLIQESRKNIE